jgi:hypothetical protein
MLDRRLKAVLGPRRPLEMWNAGVEGYNTAQEAAYLRQTGVQLRADMVLLQFHLNDFLPPPVLFRDHRGKIAYQPFSSEYGTVIAPLFRWSYIYRWLLLKWKPTREARQETSRRVVEKAMGAMLELCRQHEMGFFVAVFPLYKARADYEDTENLWHRWILEILATQKIDFVDLHAVYPADAKIERYRETMDDPWHPSVEGHRLAAQGIFTALRTRPLFARRPQGQAAQELAPGF